VIDHRHQHGGAARRFHARLVPDGGIAVEIAAREIGEREVGERGRDVEGERLPGAVEEVAADDERGLRCDVHHRTPPVIPEDANGSAQSAAR